MEQIKSVPIEVGNVIKVAAEYGDYFVVTQVVPSLGAAAIIGSLDMPESLGMGGTIEGKVEIVDYWPLKKIMAGIESLYSHIGVVISDEARNRHWQHLKEDAEAGPIIYTYSEEPSQESSFNAN